MERFSKCGRFTVLKENFLRMDFLHTQTFFLSQVSIFFRVHINKVKKTCKPYKKIVLKTRIRLTYKSKLYLNKLH